jgi:hypothetical protein
LRLIDIVAGQEMGVHGGPLAITRIDSQLDALIAITRRFATADYGFRARIRQSFEAGNGYPLALVELLDRVDAAAIKAKGSLYQSGGIDPFLIEQLEQLLQSLQYLTPH